VPRYKVRSRGRNPIDDINAELRFCLMYGCPGDDFGRGELSWDEPEPWAEVWEQFGDEVTEEFIAFHPGRRPWPWWVFTHGKERPIVHPLPPESEAAARRHSTFFGHLHSSILHGHGTPPGVLWSWQEGESEYLSRHGLLGPGELEATLASHR
jgi:hypothetical protein